MPIPAIEAAALRDLMRQVSAEMPGAPAQPLRVGEVVAGKVTLMPDGQRGILLGGVPIKATVPSDVPLGEPLKLQVTESSGNRLVLHIVKSDQTLQTQFPAQAGAVPGAPRGGVNGADPRGAAAAAAGLPNPADARAAGAAGADGKAGATASGTAAATTALGGPAAQTAQAVQSQVVDPALLTQTPWAAIPMPGGAQARMWLDPDGKGDGAEGSRGADRARTMVVRYESPTMGRVDIVLRLEPEKLEAGVLAQAGHPIAQVRAAVPQLREALAAATGRSIALTTGGRAVDSVSVNA